MNPSLARLNDALALADMDKQGLLPVVVTLGFFTNFTICKMCNGPLKYVITACD
jgi:hypothetical protein